MTIRIRTYNQPFLPIKHALVRSKTERGISSDSPSIQLARALLESALKDVDQLPDSALICTDGEERQDEQHYKVDGSDDHTKRNTEGRLTTSTPSRHSRKAKSLDLSMISRPTRLQRASSSCSASSNTSSTPPSRARKESKVRENLSPGQPQAQSHKEPKNRNQASNINDSMRPRSKSVSVLPHTSNTTTPSILLTTISESSEETSAAILSSPFSSGNSNSPKDGEATLTAEMKSTSNGSNRQMIDACALSRSKMRPSEKGQNSPPFCKDVVTQATGNHRNQILPLVYMGAADQRADQKPCEKLEADWEILSLRKRRKSSKYQPSSPSILNALLGPSSSTSPPLPSAPASPKVQPCNAPERVPTNASSAGLPLPRRRTTSFRYITTHLARPLPRYRRASANDAVVSQKISPKPSLLPEPYLKEIIRASPSTNADIWSQHLRNIIEHASTEENIHAADDSGFAPSLHDQSLCTDKCNISPTRTGNVSASDDTDELPRIPALTLISPMGTLRKYISCPDGILSASPTKKPRRPLPALPEAEVSSTATAAPSTDKTEEQFSPALPPLKRFVKIMSQSPTMEGEAQDTFTSTPTNHQQGRKKSVRRKSVINNLRSIRQTESSSSSSSTASTLHKARNIDTSTATTTTTLSGLDSFKTARSSLTGLWPPPEELFASLFLTTTGSPTILQSTRYSSDSSVTKKVPFSPSTRSASGFENHENARLSVSASYVYDPTAPDARKALQLLPRDLNTDLEVKPWMVVMPRFVLDDLAVGVRDWDKERLEVVQPTRIKSR